MRARLAFPLVLALAFTGCSGGGEAEQAARDRAKAIEAWKLVLEDGGSIHEIPIERMDIYLTEDESSPEIYEIHGDGVTLVGEFPAGVHVDYQEAFENLIDRVLILAGPTGDLATDLTAKPIQEGCCAHLLAMDRGI